MSQNKNNSQNELYHHGVPGMKWGRRKAQPTSGSTGRIRKQTKTTSTKSRKKIDLNESKRKGKTYVKTFQSKKVQAVITRTTQIASGTLWVASVFLPGPGALVANGAAAVSNMISVSVNK